MYDVISQIAILKNTNKVNAHTPRSGPCDAREYSMDELVDEIEQIASGNSANKHRSNVNVQSWM